MDWQDQSAANLPLIQIATDEKIYLFHRLTRLPPSLRKLFENEKIKKVGVAISGDLAKISRKFEIEARRRKPFDLTPIFSSSSDFFSESVKIRKIHKY